MDVLRVFNNCCFNCVYYDISKCLLDMLEFWIKRQMSYLQRLVLVFVKGMLFDYKVDLFNCQQFLCLEIYVYVNVLYY